jgi:menaquinone-dependent protoporphyrinogen IX oxidase
MKIGIVLHTVSGHTLKFAQAIRDKLVEKGHEVDLTGLKVIGTPRVGFLPGSGGQFSIKSPPELNEFEVVLIGAPVWGFKPSSVMMRYLQEDVKKLKGKKALAFVTMGACGGKKSIQMMSSELEDAGADVLEGEALAYFIKANMEKMNAAVDRICEKIGA